MSYENDCPECKAGKLKDPFYICDDCRKRIWEEIINGPDLCFPGVICTAEEMHKMLDKKEETE